jgi:tRNA(Ile)-lysidine synthase
MSASCSSEISRFVASNPVHVRRRQQSFSPESLAEILRELSAVSRFLVAYSGGCDSHVLLHAAARMAKRGIAQSLHAVHIDHGLHASSAEWARHCAAVCAELAVPFTLLQVDARPGTGESPEAAARRARYRALTGLMKPGDCLLTAHHQDDQAETLLLQLLRGGGPHGLAGMPAVIAFAAGLHARPLLAFPRDALRRYAQEHALRWVDDPSNIDSGFDRNYLRNHVLPALRERWPAAARVLARGAGHQAEAAQLLDVLAAEDLRRCEAADHTLRISALLELDTVRQRNLLRYWLKSLGFNLPDTVRLAQVQQDVLHAAEDRSPEVDWEGVTVRRYRDHLYASTPCVPAEVDTVLPWNLTRTLPLPDGGSLVAVPAHGRGVKSALCPGGAVTVRYRRGGESCQIARRGVSRPLKKLLQEAGVPPWERERIPLIYVGDQLAAVAGYWVCAPYLADEDEEGIAFEWRRGN